MYSNIKVYQKHPATSIKVGYATRSPHASPGPKAEGVPTNNQRGRGPGPRRLRGGLDKKFNLTFRYPDIELKQQTTFEDDDSIICKPPSFLTKSTQACVMNTLKMVKFWVPTW